MNGWGHPIFPTCESQGTARNYFTTSCNQTLTQRQTSQVLKGLYLKSYGRMCFKSESNMRFDVEGASVGMCGPTIFKSLLSED